ncbi:MAG: leucine-rich repeat protein [Muribaculaceae bacterium]|nr:leucine-rich repeat protein [Muribaculaceae bacterium]
MKKQLIWLSSALITLTGLNARAEITESDFEQYGLFEYNGLPYHVLEDGTVEFCCEDVIKGAYVSGNHLKMETVNIPSEVEHDGTKYRVTRIGESAFQGCTSVINVTIPEGVTEIGYQAFYNANNVKWPEMPSTLKKIGGNCFYMCRALGSIVLPEGLTTLSDGSFTRTFDLGGKIDELVFPGTLEEIKDKNGKFAQLCLDRKAGEVRKIIFNASPTMEDLKFSFNTFSRGVECPEIVINRDLVDADQSSYPVSLDNVTGLSILRFGDKVTQVPDLSSCTSLTAIYCDAPNPPAGLKLPEDAVGKITLTVPEKYLKAYYKDEAWSALLPELIEPHPVDSYVDMSRLGYIVGEGSNLGAVMITWNDGPRKGVDNLIYGVRFDKGATPEQILETVVNADPRLQRTSGGGYAYDNMDKGSIVEEYDHTADNTADSEWRIYSSEKPVDGSVIYLCYESTSKGSDDVAPAPEYTFYIPEESVIGGRIPENYEMPIADDMIIPIWVRTGGVGGAYAYFAWDAYPFEVNTQGANQAAQAEGRPYVIVDFAYVKFNDDPKNPGIHRYVPTERDVLAQVNISKSSFGTNGNTESFTSSWSEKIPMKIVAPEKPITKIIDTQVSVVGSLAQTELSKLVEYEPKDATYTRFFVEVFDENYEENAIYRQDCFPAPYTDEAEKYPGYDYTFGKMSISSPATSTVFNLKYFYGLEETGDNEYTQKNKVEGMIAFNVTSNPVKGVALVGDYDATINVDCHDLLPIRTCAFPTKANQGVKISIENATIENIANVYGVSGYMPDGETLGKFNELVTYKPGEFDLVLTSVENENVTRSYHVVVNDPMAEEMPSDFTEGTFWLNEEWFTHKNGSINYLTSPIIDSDEDIVYRPYTRLNNNGGFGATSQYAMIFADKLFVMSKQNHDQGDIRGEVGGRLVVADAHTLKKIASFAEIGGDGRACVGVNAHKAYIGHHAGVRVLTWDDADNMTLAASDIPGIGNNISSDDTSIGGNQALYNQQVGDMIATRDYVFIIQQAIGVHVVDAATDKLVKTIKDKKIGAITQTADGMVWYATGTDASSGHSMLHCINPLDLEEIRVVEVPGVISTGWGAWRSNNFFSANSKQILYWNGSASSIEASGSDIYAWDTETAPEDLKPIFDFKGVKGINDNLKQQVYATMRYDDRSGEVLFASTTSPNANYRYNWLNFYNTEEKTLRSVRLKDYYWFPAIPVFPDAYGPEMEEVDDVVLNLNDPAHEIVLNVMDRDHIDANIRCTLLQNQIRMFDDNEDSPVTASLKGNVLNIKPVKTGEQILGIMFESNGKVSTHAIKVKIEDHTTVVDGIAESNRSIRTEGNVIVIKGYAGTKFRLFDSKGIVVDNFVVDSDEAHHSVTVDSGIYVLVADNCEARKLIIRKR